MLVNLCLADTFCEVLSVSPMDMDVCDDLILGWDWISSRALHNFHVDGHCSLIPGRARQRLDQLPAEASVKPRGPPDAGFWVTEAEGGTTIPGICFSASLAADFGPGPALVAEGCAAGWGTFFLHLSPPTSGLARRRRQRGTQLVLSWTWGLLCTPLAAYSGPGSEAAAEGRAAGRGICSLRLSPPTSGLAQRGSAGVQLDGEFALYASRRQADLGPGPGAAAKGCAAGQGVFFVRLSPPTSGRARRVRHPGHRDRPARRERHRRSTYSFCGSPPLPDYCWTYVRLVLYLYVWS